MSALILVVDDEALYQRLIRVNLEAEGYQVNTAGDGEAGLEAIAQKMPDLVILDVMMPKLDGFTTCERIRQFSSVPIIMLTAKAEEEDRVRGLNAGADDYIAKPFSATELVARVRAVLRRAQRADQFTQNRYFTHGNLRIDFARILDAFLVLKAEQVVHYRPAHNIALFDHRPGDRSLHGLRPLVHHVQRIRPRKQQDQHYYKNNSYDVSEISVQLSSSGSNCTAPDILYHDPICVESQTCGVNKQHPTKNERFFKYHYIYDIRQKLQESLFEMVELAAKWVKLNRKRSRARNLERSIHDM